MLSRQTQTTFARLRIMAALLLASIAWGSTVEFTHHHGLRATGSLSGAQAANESADQSKEPRLQDGDSQRSSSQSNTRSECLICQLHHNLTTTLLSQYAAASGSESYATESQPSVLVHLSEDTATLHGRAPPLSFLS